MKGIISIILVITVLITVFIIKNPNFDIDIEQMLSRVNIAFYRMPQKEIIKRFEQEEGDDGLISSLKKFANMIITLIDFPIYITNTLLYTVENIKFMVKANETEGLYEVSGRKWRYYEDKWVVYIKTKEVEETGYEKYRDGVNMYTDYLYYVVEVQDGEIIYEAETWRKKITHGGIGGEF